MIAHRTIGWLSSDCENGQLQYAPYPITCNYFDLHSIVQVAKPMAPFIAASALTFYLVGSLQDMGVKCMFSPSFWATRVGL